MKIREIEGGECRLRWRNEEKRKRNGEKFDCNEKYEEEYKINKTHIQN